MRDIDELRRVLDAETADLAVHLPPDLIRRRAHKVRLRRASVMAAAAVLAVGAMAVPTVLSANRSSPGHDVAGPSACSTSSFSLGPTGTITWLGPIVETGVTLDAPNLNTSFDVLLGMLLGRAYPTPGRLDLEIPTYGFVIAFRDRNTGKVEQWGTTGLSRDPDGDFSGKRPGDPGHQFYSTQLVLGPHSVLDVGLYSRAADRITVASGGVPTKARMAKHAATGWTFFWVQRDAAPLPPDHNITPVEYTGPERLTITAYDADGGVQHTVTGGFHIGHQLQPRDHQPADPSEVHALPVPTCPPAS